MSGTGAGLLRLHSQCLQSPEVWANLFQYEHFQTRLSMCVFQIPSWTELKVWCFSSNSEWIKPSCGQVYFQMVSFDFTPILWNVNVHSAFSSAHLWSGCRGNRFRRETRTSTPPSYASRRTPGCSQARTWTQQLFCRPLKVTLAPHTSFDYYLIYDN